MPTQPKLSHAGVAVLATIKEAYRALLTPEALEFLAYLHERHNAKRLALLAARKVRQKRLDGGEKPDFLPETKSIRGSDWKVAAIPNDLLDRCVEITGPVDRKMIINALNSGANCFMADFEDATSPTWENIMDGQVNLYDAVRGTITHTESSSGKQYALADTIATLIVRPRGWHLDEAHIEVNGERIAGALVDFGLYFFYNYKMLLAKGTGPYFYLPKLQSHKEAELWNAIFVDAQDYVGVPVGTIKATVLIETLLAAFEMDEILYALREHIVALNCGRWDYIFSFIKTFRAHSAYVLPDRQEVTMTTPFLRAYSKLLIQTCHKRGALAMGGMAAQIPIRDNPEKNEVAMAKVHADKEREANDGHDGTWVAHPALIPVAREAFTKVMQSKKNQLDKPLDTAVYRVEDLLAVPQGTMTLLGMRSNIEVGLIYVYHWLGGLGCVPIHNLMEDAATAEISRTQVWQALHHGITLADGTVVTKAFFDQIFRDVSESVFAELRLSTDKKPTFANAKNLFYDLCVAENLEDFLTLPAYKALITGEYDGKKV